MNSPAPSLPDYLSDAEIERNVAAALAEDVGAGDLTAQLVPAGRIARATVVSREHAVLCGTAWFERCFRKLDATIEIVWHARDGEGAWRRASWSARWPARLARPADRASAPR